MYDDALYFTLNLFSLLNLDSVIFNDLTTYIVGDKFDLCISFSGTEA